MRNSQSYKIFTYFKKLNSNIFGLDPFLEKNQAKKIIDFDDIKKITDLKSVILLVDHKKLELFFKKKDLKKKIINILK